MIDIVNTLTNKRNNLIKNRQTLISQFNEDIKSIETEIVELDKAIAVINNAMTDYLCPRCHGSGTIRVCDAAGDMDDDTCPVCKGTGVKV